METGLDSQEEKKKVVQNFQGFVCKISIIPFFGSQVGHLFPFLESLRGGCPLMCVCGLSHFESGGVESRHLWWESHEVYTKNRSNLRVDLVKNDRNLHP